MKRAACRHRILNHYGATALRARAALDARRDAAPSVAFSPAVGPTSLIGGGHDGRPTRSVGPTAQHGRKAA